MAVCDRGSFCIMSSENWFWGLGEFSFRVTSGLELSVIIFGNVTKVGLT